MKKADKTVLTSVAEVIEAAGGDAEIAKRFGYADMRAPWNWRYRGYLPPDTYDPLMEILSQKGKSALRSLWRWRETVA